MSNSSPGASLPPGPPWPAGRPGPMSPGPPCSVPTCTSSNGSRIGSIRGKTTYQSRAAAPSASTSDPMILPGSPKGSLRQIQAYTGLALQLGGLAGGGRLFADQLGVHDQALVVVQQR